MEHPFFPTTTTRAEALRWLTISEKLLSVRDLNGSKSFATRARDADPSLTPADQMLAIVDTLMAGDTRIGNNQQDWYAILRLTPQQGQDVELIASQYRKLALILNPRSNKFPFAEQAFRLVIDAWSVLSNPSRKSSYDKEFYFYFHGQQHPETNNPTQKMSQNFMFFEASGPSSAAQSQVHAAGSNSVGATNFPRSQQVHERMQVNPAASGSTREQQNVINFASGSNVFYGSGSKASQEHDFKRYASFSGNANFASGSSHEPENNKQKQPMHSGVGDENKNNSNAGENMENDEVYEEEVETVDVQEDDDLSFWTSCPYCYNMFEYPKMYSDCTMRCQNCRMAFQAVMIPPPPTVSDGQEKYFCCWGFLPFGVSMENLEKNRAASSTWTPFSPMFICPTDRNGKEGGRKNSAPRVYVEDDEVFVEISDSSGSDDDWRVDEGVKKKGKVVSGRGASGVSNRNMKSVQVGTSKNVNVNVNLEGEFVPPNEVLDMPNKTTGESSMKVVTDNARKQPGRAAKNFGKLDLNVEFNNETDDPAPRVNQENGPGHGVDDNIEGTGFFEGLDEFLNSLPILNVVGDDKVIKAA